MKTPAFSNDQGQTILANVDDDTVMEPPIPSAAVCVAKSVSKISPTQGVTAKVAEHGDNVSMEPPIPSAAVSVAKTVSNLSNSYHLYIHDETFNVSHDLFFFACNKWQAQGCGYRMNTRASTKKRHEVISEYDTSSNKRQDIIFDVDVDDSDVDDNNEGNTQLTQEEISESAKNTNLDVVFDNNCFRPVFILYKRLICKTTKHPMMGSKQLLRRFGMYSDPEFIVYAAGHALCKTDFVRLAQHDGWLSDQVITFFLINVIKKRQEWILNQKVAPGMNMKRWYISSPYFYDKICPTKNANIPPWTFQLDEAMDLHQRIDFTLYSGHLIPIHLNNNHFAVLKVDFSEKTITYIDSLLDIADKAQLIMDAYIRYYCEGRASITPRKTTPIHQDEWTMHILTCADVTQQPNNYDCGVYCAMFIDFTLLDFSLKFQESLAKYYRRFMFNQIALYIRNF